ncbi:preprotein translocase subunit YajC [Caloramator quimbayensis]|uniref:Preprotein translocase subunit YajC n=1 Tax=Caloramator quimbayensis TaxID=1147123 RepID=A0A1T4WWN5_9CLOT|nr:preprotein translocase subunit YajC [Caloramator quimbayensis]SKA81041.1 preprotein translocase subunit YajC [Caloramator quimbayensis]
MQGGANILLWVLILGVFYFFLIMPEQKKQKKIKSMIEGLKVGDNVMTRSGIYGKIIDMNDNSIILETGPDKVKLSMSKYSVSSIFEKEEEVKEEVIENKEE